MFPIFIVAMSGLHARYIPHFLRGRQMKNTDQRKLTEWILMTIGMAIGFGILTSQMYPLPNTTLRTDMFYFIKSLIMMILAIGVVIYIISSSFTTDEKCENCGYYGGLNCDYCKNMKFSEGLNLIGSDLKVPRCPNCGNIWDNLSRKCSNCNYTIVLTCENCSQTINPLWKKCNLCGTPRTPVPEIALSPQTDNRFALIRARYILILLVTLPLGYLLILYISYLYSYYAIQVDSGNIEIAQVYFQMVSYVRLIVMWVVFILFTLFMINRTSGRNNGSKLLIMDEFNRLMFTDLLFVIPVILLTRFFKFPFLVNIVVFLILAVGTFIRFRNIRNYQPFSLTTERVRGYFH